MTGERKGVINRINEHPLIFGGICVVVFASIFLVLYMTVYRVVPAASAGIGKAAGTGAGIIAGEIEAIKAEEKGAEDGKAEGLSAKDTDVRVNYENELKNQKKLEVMVAGISLSDLLKLGKDYQALYITKADAVFSVDLEQAVVKWGEDGTWVKISVPQPEVDIYADQSQTKKIAEWQKYRNSGDAGDGYQAYLASVEELKKKAPKELQENETLMQNARNAAEQQIKQLAAGIYGQDVSITIEFQ